MLARLLAFLHACAAALRAHPRDALGYALACLYAVPSAWYPFGSDQGIHWYLGWGLLHGQLPYVHGISGKPPAIFWIHALAIGLFGDSQAAIRVLEILIMPVFGWLIARCARQSLQGMRDGEAGAAAILASGAIYTYHGYWRVGHPENWMALSLLAALCVALHGRRPVSRALVCGAFCTLAFMFKYTAAVIALPIAAVCGLQAMREVPARKSPLAVIASASLFLAGAALVFGFFTAPYLATGTLRQMREVCIDMTERYVRGAPTRERPLQSFFVAWDLGGTMYAAAAPAAILGSLGALVQRRFRELLVLPLLAMLAAAAVYSVVLQQRYFGYHWVVVTPFLALVLYWGGRQLCAEDTSLQIGLSILLAAAVFSFAPGFSANHARNYRAHVIAWSQLPAKKNALRKLHATFGEKGSENYYPDLERIASAINGRKRPGDTLCLDGFSSPLYQMTRLRCTSRHAIAEFVPLGPRIWASELRDDMRRHPPTFLGSYFRLRRQIEAHQGDGYREIARAGRSLALMRPR